MGQRGGVRSNAGRPKNSGKYNEPTIPIRIPLSRKTEVHQLLQNDVSFKLPFFGCSVRAGFPSPADDYIETYLDLNTHLIAHPAATFLVRAAGDSMIGAGIYHDDLLIVDRSIEATHGKIVIAAINGELTVKRLSILNGVTQLIPENSQYSPLTITEDLDLVIWGVVLHSIHSAF